MVSPHNCMCTALVSHYFLQPCLPTSPLSISPHRSLISPSFAPVIDLSWPRKHVSPVSVGPRGCLSLPLSPGSGTAGDLRPSSSGGWTQTLSPVWLSALRGGGSSVGDDSSSVHSSTIEPISSGRIRGCGALIRPLHPIRAPA